MGKRVLALIGLLALGLGGCVRATVAPSARGGEVPTMVVAGVGSVEVRPDTLVVSIGVTSERPSATEALEAVSDGARAMLEAIKDEGVAQRNIRTESLNVQPKYDDKGVIEAYVGTEMFQVEIRDLTSAGKVLGRAVDAVGDDIRVGGMSLQVADKEAFLREARQRAVEDALARARDLTEAAGIDLGPPVAVVEGRASRFPVFTVPLRGFSGSGTTSGGVSSAGGGGSAGGAIAVANIAPRIEPGTREVQVQVQVRFELRGNGS